MNEKISVIIPIYNVEKYLPKCINSVLNQTYSNLEIILVNDGSTDSCKQICEEYKKLDNRIKIINKKNGGLSDARNYGIEASTGNYIAFLDSDDWIDKELYMTLYKIIKRYDADISVCNFKKSYLNGDNKTHNSGKIKCYSNIEALNELYGKNSVQMIVAWNKLYKRSTIKELRFPVGRIHEDEYLTPIIIYNANKLVYIDNQLIYYRQTPNSIMNSKFNIKRLDYLYVLENRIEFFKENMLDQLYEKSIETYILKIIDFYFKVKYSDIKNKKNINKILIEKLDSIDNQWDVRLTKSLRKNLNLFKRYPYLYEIKICLAKLLIKLKYNIKGREF